MKLQTAIIIGVMALFVTGCACNPGYHAPFYKPVISGCVPAFVPSR